MYATTLSDSDSSTSDSEDSCDDEGNFSAFMTVAHVESLEDLKVVRKILRSLLESFRAKVTAIEESRDLDEINVQELIGFL